MRLRVGVWVTVLVLLAVLAVPSYSGLRDGAFKVQSFDMDGISVQNNADFAYGRFVLVAPNESESTPDVITVADIAKLTNKYLYIIDTRITKGAPEEPRKIDLGAYYPQKVRFDPTTENAIVSATALQEDSETGELSSYRVMVLVHLHLTDNKAEATGEPVIIKVPGVNGEDTNPEASGDFYLNKRKLVFFTGPDVCVFDLDEGNLNRVEIIPRNEYGPRKYPSFGGFDPDTDILTVVVNMIPDAGEKDQGTRSTALRFFKVKKDGALPLVGAVERFPEDEFLSADSEVAIQGMPDDSSEAQSAFLVTNTGNFYSVDLGTGSLFAEPRKLGEFPALAQGTGEPGPRIVRLVSSTGSMFVFNPGSLQLNIRRPVFGRPTRSAGIRRPVFVRSEEPSRILAVQVNSKFKIVSVSDLSYLMPPDVSVSGLVQTSDGRWIFAVSNGEMFVAGISESGEAKVDKLGDIGHPRVESVAYNDERNSLVALCSSGESGELQAGSSVEAEGLRGAVVIARINEGKSSPVALSIAQMLSPSAPGLGSVTTSIRRPCNVGR